MTQSEKFQIRENQFVKPLSILLLVIVLVIVIATPASAAISDSFRNLGGRIGSSFNSFAENEEPGIIDFLLFAVIFFAVCWISFNAVFKDGKNANVVLSLALSIALSIALVYGGKFTVKKLLPFASAILLLLVFIGIYALLTKFVFTGNTAGSKILAFIFALVVSIILISLFTSMICKDNTCENNAFFRKIFGSESIFGSLFEGADELFETDGASTPENTQEGIRGPNATTLCGNGIVDQNNIINESCDIGWDRNQNYGCSWNEKCKSDCSSCESMSVGDIVGDYQNILKIFGIIIVIILLFLIIGKRKSIGNKVSGWWNNKWKKRKELDALNNLLNDLAPHERTVANHLSQLITAVKHEKEPFYASRDLVMDITRDIKDTIGEELELIEDAAKKGNLTNNLNTLHSLNNSERNQSNFILHEISQELDLINAQLARGNALRTNVDDLENLDVHFAGTSEIIDTFGKFNLKEKNLITKIEQDLTANVANFTQLRAICEEMLTRLNEEINLISAPHHSGRINYDVLIGAIRRIRNLTIELNQRFSRKVILLQDIMKYVEQIKSEMKSLQDEEVRTIQRFLAFAQQAVTERKYDNAIYFASHVIENADHLQKGLDDAQKQQIVTASAESQRIILNSIPEVLRTVLPKIERELLDGEYNQVKDTLMHLKVLHFNNADYRRNIAATISDYNHRIEQCTHICDDMQTRASTRAQFNALLIRLRDVINRT